MGQRLMHLNNVQWRRGESLRMQVIFTRMSLDEIVKYITVELKLNAKNEAHVQDRQRHQHRGYREHRQHREVQGDTVGTAEEGSGSGQDLWTVTTREDHEEAHLSCVCSAQYEGAWAGQVQLERSGPKVQGTQGTAEDREPAALVPRVQITARRLLGLLRQEEQPCT